MPLQAGESRQSRLSMPLQAGDSARDTLNTRSQACALTEVVDLAPPDQSFTYEPLFSVCAVTEMASTKA
jgi:hypothetical protein